MAKLKIVLTAGQSNADEGAALHEWDMWGPLLFSLLLAMYGVLLFDFIVDLCLLGSGLLIQVWSLNYAYYSFGSGQWPFMLMLDCWDTRPV